MKKETKTPRDIDEYIARFPPGVQERLRQVRATIRKAAPAAEETISYQMPAFRLEGNLVYFAAFKHHLGLYPRTSAIAKFQKELAKYQSAKGSVKFPHEQPLPLGLIRQMVKFRAQENRAAAKKNERKR
ncbi:MAG: iron chaperone [Chthoniobacterales bacterium]